MSMKIALVAFLLAVLGKVHLQEISTQSCGVSKGCYRSPANCQSSDDCDYLVTYFGNQETVSFEVSVKGAAKWVALGFNDDAKMTGGAGEICVLGANGPSLQGFKNTAVPYGVPTLYPMAGKTALKQLKVINGALVCRFTRSIQQDATYQLTLDTPRHFIVAGGKSLSQDEKPAYHGSLRIASPSKFTAVFTPRVVESVTIMSSMVASVQTTQTVMSKAVRRTSIPAAVSTTVLPSGQSSAPAMSQAVTATVPLAMSISVVSNPSTHAVPSAEPSASRHAPTVVPSAEPTGKTNTTVNPVTKSKPNGASFTGPTILTVVASLLLAKLSLL